MYLHAAILERELGVKGVQGVQVTGRVTSGHSVTDCKGSPQLFLLCFLSSGNHPMFAHWLLMKGSSLLAAADE